MAFETMDTRRRSCSHFPAVAWASVSGFVETHVEFAPGGLQEPLGAHVGSPPPMRALPTVVAGPGDGKHGQAGKGWGGAVFLRSSPWESAEQAGPEWWFSHWCVRTGWGLRPLLYFLLGIFSEQFTELSKSTVSCRARDSLVLGHGSSSPLPPRPWGCSLGHGGEVA